MAGLNTGDKLTRLENDDRLGMHRDSEYLGAEDIDPGTEPILTIEGLWYGEVTLQRGKEKKDVITFVERSTNGIGNVRPLIINATNRKTLKKLYNSVRAKDLVGKQIQLYIDHRVRDPQDGSMTDGIRIRPFIPKPVELRCSACKKLLTPAYGMTTENLAAYTKKKYGAQLCADCASARSATEKATSSSRKTPAQEKPADEQPQQQEQADS